MPLISNFDLSLSPGHSDSPDENHDTSGCVVTAIFAIGPILYYIKAQGTTAMRHSRLSRPKVLQLWIFHGNSYYGYWTVYHVVLSRRPFRKTHTTRLTNPGTVCEENMVWGQFTVATMRYNNVAMVSVDTVKQRPAVMQFTALSAAGDRRTRGLGRSPCRRRCADAHRGRRAAGSVAAVGRVQLAFWARIHRGHRWARVTRSDTGRHGHAASGASTGPGPADGRRPPQRNIAIKNSPRWESRWRTDRVRFYRLLSFVFLLLLSYIKANGGSAGPWRRLEARAGWPPYGAESTAAAAATTALVACVAWRRQRWRRDVWRETRNQRGRVSDAASSAAVAVNDELPAEEAVEEEEGGRMQIHARTHTHTLTLARSVGRSVGTRTRIQLVMLKPSHAAALGTR